MEDQTKTLWFVTFGQISPFRDGYVRISASSREDAQDEAMRCLGEKWSMLYSYEEFEKSAHLFSMGQLGHELKGI